jgi:hypothetical protein
LRSCDPFPRSCPSRRYDPRGRPLRRIVVSPITHGQASCIRRVQRHVVPASMSGARVDQLGSSSVLSIRNPSRTRCIDIPTRTSARLNNADTKWHVMRRWPRCWRSTPVRANIALACEGTDVALFCRRAFGEIAAEYPDGGKITLGHAAAGDRQGPRRTRYVRRPDPRSTSRPAPTAPAGVHA